MVEHTKHEPSTQKSRVEKENGRLRWFVVGGVLLVCAAVFLFVVARLMQGNVPTSEDIVRAEKLSYNETRMHTSGESGEQKTIVVAGGCFWCVEADMEKIPGVVRAISGYAGGASEDPTYENYAQGGHREVVEVTYDTGAVTLEGLLTFFLKHIDPTDGEGSFYDRGVQYSPAIYVADSEERAIAEKVLAEIESRDVFPKPLAVPVLEKVPFWPAEEYHQDYYKNHSLKYSFYRSGSGRDRFIEQYWGDEARMLPTNIQPSSQDDAPWKSFTKPSQEELKATLSAIQYKVTQRDGTERAFDNEYWNTKDEGIYVDIVSGEPLFSSVHKYDSGTGWPSFTMPLEAGNIVERDDFSLFGKRIEIRSKYGDSHVGHVFADGPAPTGLRYCMNSAALRFVPKETMQEEGYGTYLSLFDKNFDKNDASEE